MIEKIHHVGLAVKSLDAARVFFEDVLGLKLNTDYETRTPDFISRFVSAGPYSNFELLEPVDPNGLIGRFIRDRGEGIHHVSILVDNVSQMVDALEAKGVQLVGVRKTGPLKGAFVHPKSALGVLIEITEGVKGIDE